MIIYKTKEGLKDKFDILDSIICDIKWDNNLLDLLITIDYYSGKDQPEKLYIIRLKDCYEAHFTMPKNMKSINSNERKDYVWSWYTAINMDIAKNESLEVKIKTNLDTDWLFAKCEEVWIEDKE